MLNDIASWLTDPVNWAGPRGIPTRIMEHLWYSALALAFSAAVALPAGLWVGHTGRGRWVVTISNVARAVPSLGLLFAVEMIVGPHFASNLAFIIPSIVVLFLLGVPPLLSGTYAGIQAVDPAARDAAYGMGMSSREVLRGVEVPCAMPLVMSGLRASTLQIIATATIAASVSLGGLGRYLLDGLAVRDYAEMAGGAILVAALALILEGILIIVTRYAVSPGLTGRFPSSSLVAGSAATPVTTDKTPEGLLAPTGASQTERDLP
ncbi:MAG: ABC transporter permease [Dermatophilaceae bacterium]